MSAALSVVIPALDAARTIGAAIDSVASPHTGEILVADGGSTDDTRAVAEAHGARVIEVPKGRGAQLCAGAAAAGGGWLLFLHADTRLSPSWQAEAGNFMDIPSNRRRAGVFRFRLDSSAPEARRLEGRVDWRCRRLGLPYGDQGLLISRRLYEEIGGFAPVPLMEDVDIVRRIGRRRLHFFDAAAITSAAKFERDGWRRRSARNLVCLTLWFAGVPPRLIARLYGR
ncbi:TIGR04283 family arsenosugar biosynthesis glycosyltransferase [Minwuia thermotolerans]|uniref:Glycosyl transferase family 2 n=1 Tax=Minwuia thermotolerans TaxID=2056226 RepID=A0A2M9G3W6_9PROT|nr:TIGR04283 family arsenosugar biosynthesis glycosyltransferase [Minwuia thermotolerans]PJK30417.1 glycosyl transferase family 2 [Minwuia thermotolerans]